MGRPSRVESSNTIVIDTQVSHGPFSDAFHFCLRIKVLLKQLLRQTAEMCAKPLRFAEVDWQLSSLKFMPQVSCRRTNNLKTQMKSISARR